MDQIQIIQEIVSRAIPVDDPDWTEFIIDYHVDEEQSEFANTYLTTRDGETREKPLQVANDLDAWLRKLRAELAQAGRPPFSSCKLHVFADGRFESSYGYDPIDWDELMTRGWNFPHVTSLH